MRIQKGSTTLVIMLIVAGAAILFGLAVIYKRIVTSPAPAEQTSATQTQDLAPDQSSAPEPEAPIGFTAPANWLTYTNAKHGFSLQYPPNLKVGAVSANSVLGTYSVPVKGFHVGPLVMVVLKDANIKQDALDYFNGLYNPNPNQAPVDSGFGLTASCKIDQITNPSVVSIKSVSCTGEGGAGSYAYIHGLNYDVFVDGYSKGYDKTSFGELANSADYGNILSTFKFNNSTLVQ